MASASPPAPLFTPPADRRNALDRAHMGDIEGAFGTVRADDTGPRLSHRRRLATLLAILGPGIMVMVADNDAGSISVFSQAGQDHGLRLLWILLLLGPALYVTQEMVARLGAVTGAGHARLTLERFGRLWCAFSLGDLLVLNLATLVTEFIGVALALDYLGVSRDISVPLAAVALVVVSTSGSFRRWERAMYVMIGADLLLIPLALAGHTDARHIPLARIAAHAPHGVNATILLLVALIGTTLAPWQLFFQQSTVVDKRITPRWLSYERADTAIGAALFALVAAAVLIISASVLSGTPLHGHFTNVGVVVHAIGHHLGRGAGTLFAIALFNASLLGAGAVSLSSSYAVSEVLGVKHSLHRRFSDARTFHGLFAAIVAASAAIVLIPGLPLGATTTIVQALTGVLLPSTLVLLVLLCNDAELLGPMRNGPWLNAIAVIAITLILALSTLLTLSLALPHLALGTSILITAGMIAATAGLLITTVRRGASTGSIEEPLTPWERRTWSSPRLEQVRPAAVTRPRVMALALVRTYVFVIVGLFVVSRF